MSFRGLLPMVLLLVAGSVLLASACTAKPAPAPDKGVTVAGANAAKVVEIAVTENGFEPASIKLAKGVPVKVVVTRKTERTCARQIVVKDYGIKSELPLNQAVEINLTPKAAGSVVYACSMGMISGVLIIE